MFKEYNPSYQNVGEPYNGGGGGGAYDLSTHEEAGAGAMTYDQQPPLNQGYQPYNGPPVQHNTPVYLYHENQENTLSKTLFIIGATLFVMRFIPFFQFLATFAFIINVLNVLLHHRHADENVARWGKYSLIFVVVDIVLILIAVGFGLISLGLVIVFYIIYFIFICFILAYSTK